MSSLKISIPHQLSQAEALERIKTLLTNLQEEQRDRIKNVFEDWNENTGKFSFTAQGFDLDGKITVNTDSVDIDASLPFALSFFKGAITKVIQEKASKLLS